jgi:hypothetical protein
MGSRCLGDYWRREPRVPAVLVDSMKRSAAEALLAENEEAWSHAMRALWMVAPDVEVHEVRGLALAMLEGRAR